VAEHNRLPCAPVFVIDLRTIFRRNHAHFLFPFLLAMFVIHWNSDLVSLSYLEHPSHIAALITFILCDNVQIDL
jgi:hypothetical protein